MIGANRRVAVCHLGLSEYQRTWELQKAIQSLIVETKRVEPKHTTPHVLLTVEHPPVYTLGKSGNEANLLADAERLSRIGATFERIDRGGDITFHGPGQLVVYPILDLGHFYTDIHRYLRDLEETVIRTCGHFGLNASRVTGRTGVWVNSAGSTGGEWRKICAMGIKCSRWVTSHGLALNVNTDLSYFGHIVPCGINDASVTSLSRELSAGIEIEDVLPVFLQQFRSVFGVEIAEYSGSGSDLFIESYLSRVNS